MPDRRQAGSRVGGIVFELTCTPVPGISADQLKDAARLSLDRDEGETETEVVEPVAGVFAVPFRDSTVFGDAAPAAAPARPGQADLIIALSRLRLRPADDDLVEAPLPYVPAHVV